MNIRSIASAGNQFIRNCISAAGAEPEYVHRKRIHLAKKIHTAGDYKEWLSAFHSEMKPRTYLEIGVADGATLALVRPETNAVGVDPDPKIKNELLCSTRLFKTSSDDFFLKNKIETLVGGKADLVFIDGLHEFKQVIRDVANAGNNAKDNAVILVHDVLPVDQKSASPKRKTLHWPGDVYKAVAFIKRKMPALNLDFINAYPTGLAVITGCGSAEFDTLNQGVSEENLREFENLSVEDYYSSHISEAMRISGTAEPIQDTVVRLLSDRVGTRFD
ncbi:class I SAM-dependent methyltransferase [Spiribacter onubensis]|uniref:Class I SAM-dependent methyltransferase n=1 Tax=Spiribacter onubensis TaxID=3122420 RepID=A0ABV3SBA1_9GAMM